MENKPIKYSQAQLLAIEIMATDPSISLTSVAKKLNIERKTLHNWMGNITFIDQLYKRYMEISGVELPAVIAAMIEEAKAGNVQAGRLILEHYGKLENKIKVQVESPFEKFLHSDNAEEAEFFEVKDEDKEFVNKFDQLMDTKDIELPKRDKSNDKPRNRAKEEIKKLDKSYKKVLKDSEIKYKQQSAYQIRKRAIAVGLPLLKGGRQSKGAREKWLKELERLEKEQS